MEMESFVQKPREGEITRQSAGFTPSVWGDYFIKHHSPLPSTIQKSEDWIRERVAELVIQVKSMLKNSGNDDLKSLELIDTLQHLGVGYHFEEEIEGSLKRIHDEGKTDGSDLHAVALQFRLLRLQGFNVKSDVFNKFKDDGGEFKSHLANDARGLLSLYEACFMATHEDGILDKALGFARRHLRNLSAEDSALNSQVSHALEMPLHRRIPRLEARYYMEAYEEDKEHKNEVILELAKLDFHLLQSLHFQEARSISMWREEIGLGRTLGFARDRIVECHFWALSMYSEPQYSLARKMTAKMIVMLSITDDIYDSYGTTEELRSFTDVIERWDVEAAEQLEEYLKVQFQNLQNILKEFEEDLSSCRKSYCVDYIKELLKVVVRAWFVEVKWRDEGYVPSLKEHLQLTTVSSCYNLIACVSFLGTGESATKEVFDWVLSYPSFTHHAAAISRLRDDVTTQEFEQQRNHVASSVQCYMKEHNTTPEKACEKLLEMVEDEWKSLNQEYLRLCATFSRDILMRVINFSRLMDSIYDGHDKYTNPSMIKDYISKILIEPVCF